MLVSTRLHGHLSHDRGEPCCLRMREIMFFAFISMNRQLPPIALDSTARPLALTLRLRLPKLGPYRKCVQKL
jgi:hypothetical protein